MIMTAVVTKSKLGVEHSSGALYLAFVSFSSLFRSCIEVDALLKVF